MFSATTRNAFIQHAARPVRPLTRAGMLTPTRGFGALARPLPTMSDMGIKLIVCDMAGTTVEEHGIVYKTLREAMVSHGLSVSEDEMHPWHGAAKGAVTAHFLDREPSVGVTAKQIDATFEELVTKAYGAPGATDLISPDLCNWISQCQEAGIKVGLNTGYPVSIQEGLLTDLKLDGMVDCWVSASQVAEGRPYPYMVHRLMEQMGIMDCSQVAKFGDTVNDIKEGKNAGCGLVVGVLSGADSALDLYEAGADVVVPDVTHIDPGKVVNKTALSGVTPVELENKTRAESPGTPRRPAGCIGCHTTTPSRLHACRCTRNEVCAPNSGTGRTYTTM